MPHGLPKSLVGLRHHRLLLLLEQCLLPLEQRLLLEQTLLINLLLSRLLLEEALLLQHLLLRVLLLESLLLHLLQKQCLLVASGNPTGSTGAYFHAGRPHARIEIAAWPAARSAAPAAASLGALRRGKCREKTRKPHCPANC